VSAQLKEVVDADSLDAKDLRQIPEQLLDGGAGSYKGFFQFRACWQECRQARRSTLPLVVNGRASISRKADGTM